MVDQQKFDSYKLEKQTQGNAQKIKSNENLKETEKTLDKVIQEIRITTQNEETRRISNNLIEHNKREELLRQMEESIPEDMRIIEEKIRELMEIEQADTLNAEFIKLKEMCEETLNKKRNNIRNFVKELEFKDQTYVDNLKLFRNNIEKMINLMRNQFIVLRDDMLKHLEDIEKKFKEDRKNLLDDYKRNIDKLIQDLEMTEQKNEKSLSEKQDEKEREIDIEVYKHEMDFINKVLIMEKYYNFLREHIEDYTYDLKILFERLEYRVEVRDEKIKENEDKMQLYTKMYEKIRSKLFENIAYYNINDAKSKDKNISLKDHFRKMTKSFNDLKRKFKHFEIYDDLQLEEIYKMKYKEAQELGKKVIYARTTINSQQLGIENDFEENKDGITLEELQKEETNEKNVEEKVQRDPNEDENIIQNILAKLPTERIKQAFYFIIQEAEFLIETSIIDQCKGMEIDEKLPYYMESLCRSMGIKTDEDLTNLLALFDKKNNATVVEEVKPEDDFNAEEDMDNSNKTKQGNAFDLKTDEILMYLKEFLQDKKKRRDEQINREANNQKLDKNKDNNEEVKKERIKNMSEKIWIRIGKVISEKTYNVWLALDKGLTRYKALLDERKSLIDDTKVLFEKNKELKGLLKQYMESEDNDALHIAPYQTIKMENINLAMNNIEKNSKSLFHEAPNESIKSNSKH